jgi:hypothetical protein
VMGTKERIFSPLPYDVSLEDLVPKDNCFRHLKQTLDLSFVRDLVHTSPGEAGSAIGKFCLPTLVGQPLPVRLGRRVMKHAPPDPDATPMHVGKGED